MGSNTRVHWWSLVSTCCFGTIRQRLWRTMHGVLWSSGVWLGRSDATDESIIGTATGVKLIRTIRRRPVGEQYSTEAVQSMRGTPWQLTTGRGDDSKPASPPTAVPMPATFPPAPSPGDSAPTPVIAPEVSQQDQHQSSPQSAGAETPGSQQSSSSSSSSSSDQSDMQAEPQIAPNGGQLGPSAKSSSVPAPRGPRWP